MLNYKYAILVPFIMVHFSLAQIPLAKSEENPVLIPGSSEDWDAGGPQVDAVLFEGDRYHMWYTGVKSDGSSPAIGYATSADGLSWVKYENNPVFQKGLSGAWDEKWVGSVTVIKIDTVFHMWYGSGDGLIDRIGYATSSDGINWERNPENPVLNPGESGSWDNLGVQQPCVLFDGNLFHMWYHSPQNSGSFSIGYATSENGITWKKYEHNPVLEAGSSNEWDNIKVISPAVVKSDNKYHMWYQGSNGETSQIGYAVSEDGIIWEKSESNPVLSPGPDGSWDEGHTASPAALLNVSEPLFHLWYSGIDNNDNWQVGHASAVSSLVAFEFEKTLDSFELIQNYPNPFNPSTTIEFALPRREYTELKIYNILGAHVETLVSKNLPAGKYSYSFDGSKLASGVYYYQVTAGKFRDVKKMILLK